MLIDTIYWYFFDYKTVFFPFQNSPSNLDPSYYKRDLDFWNCFGSENLSLEENKA